MSEGLLEAFRKLIFPHTCAVCGTNQLEDSDGLCIACLWNIPTTNFVNIAGNEVEKIFWGRLPLVHASAASYFTTKSAVQKMLHQLKYNHRRDVGSQLGKWMGAQLATVDWKKEIDCILPMPIHPTRKATRGYNQAALLCEGIHQQTGIPFQANLLERNKSTRSLTTQHRAERWTSMQEVFSIKDSSLLTNKHILLVDDVVTTGATIEAMGEKILECVGTRLSIYCFAYTLPH